MGSARPKDLDGRALWALERPAHGAVRRQERAWHPTTDSKATRLERDKRPCCGRARIWFRREGWIWRRSGKTCPQIVEIVERFLRSFAGWTRARRAGRGRRQSEKRKDQSRGRWTCGYVRACACVSARRRIRTAFQATQRSRRMREGIMWEGINSFPAPPSDVRRCSRDTRGLGRAREPSACVRGSKRGGDVVGLAADVQEEGRAPA